MRWRDAARGESGRVRRLPPHIVGAALPLVAAVVAAGCMPNAPTKQGQAVNQLYLVFLAGGAIVGALVWSLTTWAILRYRRSGPELPRQTAGNGPLEVIWTTLPFLTVGFLFVLTVITLNVVDARTTTGGVDVRVTGTRWQWRFDYPQSGVTVIGTPGGPPPEMVVPVGETIHLTVVSTDVNHSFYVPAFLFKRDAIPGITNHFDLDIQQAGSWSGQCAEFCGTYHDQMLFTVVAEPASQFQQWLATARGASGAPSGTPELSPAPASASGPQVPSTPAASAPAGESSAPSQPGSAAP